MQEVTSILQVAIVLDRNGQQYMQVADKLRRAVSPARCYPGVMGDMPVKQIEMVLQILHQFAKTVLTNAKMFKIEHISRAVDAMQNAALALVCRYMQTKDESDLDEAVQIENEVVAKCKEYVPGDLKFIASAAFNLAAFIFKSKVYEKSRVLLDHVIEITRELKDRALFGKANKLKAQCLIGLGLCSGPEFSSALAHSNDIENLLFSLISLHPPTDTRIVAQFLPKLQRPGLFAPYFALNGDLRTLASFPEYANFFPNLQPPKVSLVENRETMIELVKCHQLFEAGRFLECVRSAVELLKTFPREKLKPNDMLALFFIHYWIACSFVGFGKPEAGLWYAKQMRKIMAKYPFAVGFAIFLELKCKIHMAKLERLRRPPEITFPCQVSWESVGLLRSAIIKSLEMDENCFLCFEQLFQSNNLLIQREAVHYYVMMSRVFDISVNVSEFKDICVTSRETHALYLYHQVIESLKYEDIDPVWNYKRPKPLNPALMETLAQAESLARGFSHILRKVRQLQALISGVTDQSKTAKLIASSLSISIDKFLPRNNQERFKLQFPLLAIAYFAVAGLDKCLMMALFHPSSDPFVVRIKTEDKVETFLEELAAIHAKSTALSTSLSTQEWWDKKRSLDNKLGDLLEAFEDEVLGPWSGLLTPLIFKPAQNSVVSALTAAIQLYNPSDQPSVREEARAILGVNINPALKCDGKLSLALLLGKDIHKIPWESLPSVTKRDISMTRVPSLKSVALQTAKRLPVSIDPHSAFYVLNPAGDLRSTENQFKPVFSDLSWNGITRTKPKGEDIEKAIRNKDLFVYCGHGSGSEYYDYYSLLEEQKQCRASMLLMGCSSGELIDDGEMDPFGVPYYCIASGSGTVVANLWNVTDKDIDRFLLCLLNQTLKNGPHDLEGAVKVSRKACKLKYLTGAAPVIYGFPTVILPMEDSKRFLARSHSLRNERLM